MRGLASAAETLLTSQTIDPAHFRQVLGHYPTGVAAITALGPDGQPMALVVGTFTSVSLDPPLVGFLPDRRSASWPLIEASGRFAANILGADQLGECGIMAGKGDKFAGVEWRLSPGGLPLLTRAIATIECTIAGVQDAGDHVFVLGRVETMAVLRDDDPMLFWRGRYGGFAA